MLPASVIHTSGARSGDLDDTFRNRIDGRCHDHELSLRNAVRQIRNSVIDRTDLASHVETLLPAPDANDLLGQLSLAKCQTNRATNQSHADDGYRFILDHVRILNRTRRVGEGANRINDMPDGTNRPRLRIQQFRECRAHYLFTGGAVNPSIRNVVTRFGAAISITRIA